MSFLYREIVMPPLLYCPLIWSRALHHTTFDDIFYLSARILTRALPTTSKITVLRLSGLTNPYEFVMAMCCLRYLHSPSIQSPQEPWGSQLHRFMTDSSLPLGLNRYLRKADHQVGPPSITTQETPDGWYVDGCYKHLNFAGSAAILIVNQRVVLEIGVRLMGHLCSPLTSEIHAIYLASIYNRESLPIFTDSRQAAKLMAPVTSQSLFWCPRDHPYIKMADRACRNPALPVNILPVLIAPSITRAVLLRKRTSREIRRWTDGLSKYGKTINTLISRYGVLQALSGHVDSKSMRLLQGHNNLGRHLLLRGHTPRDCLCNKPVPDAAHIVLECDFFSTARKLLFGTTTCTPQEFQALSIRRPAEIASFLHLLAVKARA